MTEDICLPYELDELTVAEQRLTGLDSASPASLPEYATEFKPTHVLRRRDLIDLFDTTADLSGYDLDVSRFIRSERDRDVLIAWRDEPPNSREDGPTRDELCSAPIRDVVDLLKVSKKGKQRLELYAWYALDGEWQKVTDAEKLRPGMMLIANAKGGCYDVERGWDPASLEAVQVVPEPHSTEEGNGDDPLTFRSYTQTLAAHSREVSGKMSEIVEDLWEGGIDLSGHREDLVTAALHHDWGKAHPVFQATVNPEGDTRMLAKSKNQGRHRRKHFRHELASALALLQTGSSDLSVFLAAAHHGKVRLSIRAMPEESKPELDSAKFARGIHEGDSLPEAELDGISKAPLTLDLEPMLLGRSETGARSWMERMLDLRDELGVFRLAYLEALIVAADRRASAEPKEVLA